MHHFRKKYIDTNRENSQKLAQARAKLPNSKVLLSQLKLKAPPERQ